MGVCSTTLKLKEGSIFYGGQQWGILDNGRKSDPMIEVEGEKDSTNAVKLFLLGTIMTVLREDSTG